ncbi:unnamed protein product [Caenorhabditis brenneri]
MFLFSHFKQFQSTNSEHLKEFVTDASLNDFEKLLLVLNEFNMIDDENVVAIVRLARKYGMESVVRKCEQFLIKDSKKSPDHLTTLAKEFNLDLLKLSQKPPPVSQTMMNCLKCPVCYSIYEEIPRILQCGHTFCNACLKQLCSAKCPICGKVFVPGSATLNYALMNVIDAVPAKPTNGFKRATKFLMGGSSNIPVKSKCQKWQEEGAPNFPFECIAFGIALAYVADLSYSFIKNSFK